VRILALITARGGSKRLPGKNLRVLGDRSLIAWSVDAARAIPEICEILVSTDDAAIAAEARTVGAQVPWLRPAELASDAASSVDVCLHALDWYENQHADLDGLLLLQPTSPFRRRDTLMRGVELFSSYGRRAVIGVSPAASHPLWCFRLDGQVMRPFIEGPALNVRSQDLPPAYVVNGAFYLIAPQELRKRRTFYGDDMLPLVMDDPAEAIDIDTEWDWMVAQAALASGRSRAQ
jgi:CMP-N,N'-diacetyllegionaminic acid synthase